MGKVRHHLHPFTRIQHFGTVYVMCVEKLFVGVCE